MNILCISRSASIRFVSFSHPLIKRNIRKNINRCKQSSVSFSNRHLPFDNISNLKKDVLLYTFEKTKLIKYLTVFGIAQLGVWIFYAGYMFVNLRDISKSGIKNEVLTESSLWRRINLGETKYRIITTVLCFGVGLFTAFITYTLPTRIVKELTLCKGGTIASVVTYGPFGKNISLKVPLKKLSCVVSRDQAKSYIPIKIKNSWFYYLVDCKGQFHQPQLFDYTIGRKVFKGY